MPRRLALLLLTAGACASTGGGTSLTGPSVPSDDDLMFELKVDLGNRGFERGDALAITRVLGDRPRLGRDGWYQVQGTWKVVSHDEALLELRCANGKAVGDVRRYVRRGSGTFAVTFRLVEEGFLHVSLYSVDGRSFGGAYLGQGDGVYRGEHVPGR